MLMYFNDSIYCNGGKMKQFLEVKVIKMQSICKNNHFNSIIL